jgi:hypothetical protein
MALLRQYGVQHIHFLKGADSIPKMCFVKTCCKMLMAGGNQRFFCNALTASSSRLFNSYKQQQRFFLFLSLTSLVAG